MAKWREREHILNRFPSSVRDIFMCRATGYRCLPVCVRIARLRCFVSPPLSRRACSLRGLVSFFFGGSEFKRFKAISLGVARRILSSSNADRPTRILFPLFHLRFCFDSFRSWVGVSQAREYSFASLLGGYDLSYGDNFFLYRLWNILIGNCIPYLFLFWLLRIVRESSCLLFVSIDNFPTSEAIQ